MLRPVGSEPPGVYWRRRLALFGSVFVVLVLIVLTVHVLTSGGGNAVAGGTGTTPGTSRPPGTSPQSHPKRSTSTSRTHSADSSDAPISGSQSPPSSSTRSSAPPKPCTAAQLGVTATSNQTSYKVGDEPTLELQVVNTGTVACVQNLADSQVVLKVYNGAARVWGSHDCMVQPGTDERTLAVGVTVRISIVWSGMSSSATSADCGPRQQIGAGTYTLYPTLSGKTGRAYQFTIS